MTGNCHVRFGEQVKALTLLVLLKQIQSFFGVGGVRLENRRRAVIFRVSSIEDSFNYIIPHFDKYPLLTKKREDFVLFKSAIELMKKKRASLG